MKQDTINEILDVLQINDKTLKTCSKKIEELDAWYIWNPIRGGKSMIIDDFGNKLVANSFVDYKKLISDFKIGKRTFNSIKEIIDNTLNKYNINKIEFTNWSVDIWTEQYINKTIRDCVKESLYNFDKTYFDIQNVDLKKVHVSELTKFIINDMIILPYQGKEFGELSQQIYGAKQLLNVLSCIDVDLYKVDVSFGYLNGGVFVLEYKELNEIVVFMIDAND